MRQFWAHLISPNLAEDSGGAQWLADKSYRQWLTVIALCLLTGAVLTWSLQFCNTHDADSVILSIMAQQKLTLFYWGQNRYMNLIPLVTAWISDISINQQVQVWLRASTAAAFPLFVIVLLQPKASLLLCFAASLTALLTIFQIDLIRILWTDGQPYGLSLVLMTGAMLVTSRLGGRRIARPLACVILASGLVVLAMLVNASLIIVAAPLFGLLILFAPSIQNVLLFAMSLGGYMVSKKLSNWIGGREYDNIIFDPANLSMAWNRIMAGIDGTALGLLAFLFVSGLIVMQMRHRATRSDGDPVIAPIAVRSIALSVACLIYMLLVPNIEWVILNLSHVRYYGLILVLGICLFAVVIVETLVDGERRIGMALAPLALLMAVLVLFRTSWPIAFPPSEQCSFIAMEPGSDTQSSGSFAQIALDRDIHLILGSYRMVWPAIYEAIRLSGRDDIYGMTMRAEEMRPQILSLLDSNPDEHLLCIDKDIQVCLQGLTFSLGSGEYHGKPLSEAIEVVEEGTTPAGQYYRIIDLKEGGPAPDAEMSEGSGKAR
jgi:hypothetical protein